MTGAGKTYTIQGPSEMEEDCHAQTENKGLKPRVFDHLWECIDAEKDNDDTLEFLVKVSFIEI